MGVRFRDQRELFLGVRLLNGSNQMATEVFAYLSGSNSQSCPSEDWQDCAKAFCLKRQFT